MRWGQNRGSALSVAGAQDAAKRGKLWFDARSAPALTLGGASQLAKV